MVIDDTAKSEQEFIAQVRTTCKALDVLHATDPLETGEPGPVQDEWVKALNALNIARIKPGMASEQIHDEKLAFIL